MEKMGAVLLNWKLHLTVMVIVAAAEMVNVRSIPLGRGSILFLPLLYAIIMGLAAFRWRVVKWISKEQSVLSSRIVIIGISLFLAKVSVTSGAELAQIIQAGPALLLHELGNLGSMFLGLPVALLLGFKREAVGMTYSIDREPNVGLIAAKYGLDSPEGRGTMVTYATGTLIGTVFIGILASFMAAITPLHPLALAIACGVGSGSMLAASSSVLAQTFPNMADQIIAYAAASNVIANASGIIVSITIGLPLCNFLYKKLSPILGNRRKKRPLALKGETGHE